MDKKKTVARWHPWLDKPGCRHTLVLWQDISTSLQDELTCIEYVGKNQLYVFCNDILDNIDIPYSDELLLHPKTEAYMQKSGKVVAVRVKSGRTCGFLIPSRTWGFAIPDQDMIEATQEIFHLFNFEGITPGSVSEKVLRSTLGTHLHIYRPASDLRRILLENCGGGRIDMVETGQFYRAARKYDINKAYLFFARLVPSPYIRPWRHYKPDNYYLDHHITGYWRIQIIAHGNGLHPIQIEENGKKRFPKDGEQLTIWLWTEEIRACVHKGYTLVSVLEGYGWDEMSDFMRRWGDILWKKYQDVSGDKTMQRIIKSMMVGLPGRFLKEPMNYLLIPKDQAKTGDTAITFNWYHFPENWKDYDEEQPKQFFTNWYLRPEYDLESTALTPIGAYIIMKCRMEIYNKAREEEDRGNKLISSYIDCLTFEYPASSLALGDLPGEYKVEEYQNVWAEFNRFIGEQEGIADMRAPGASGDMRVQLWKKYRDICKIQSQNT